MTWLAFAVVLGGGMVLGVFLTVLYALLAMASRTSREEERLAVDERLA